MYANLCYANAWLTSCLQSYFHIHCTLKKIYNKYKEATVLLYTYVLYVLDIHFPIFSPGACGSVLQLATRNAELYLLKVSSHKLASHLVPHLMLHPCNVTANEGSTYCMWRHLTLKLRAL